MTDDPDPPDRWADLGEFIRQQRNTARLSLRRLSEIAGISNPYLSQIERGLRKPSAEILQQIAKALRISAETLYVRAGILEDERRDDDLVRHILDRSLPCRGAAPGARAHLPVVPPRERRRRADRATGGRARTDRVEAADRRPSPRRDLGGRLRQ